MNESGRIQTLLGPIKPEDMGFVLPHEHLFTDLRGPSVPDYAQAPPEQVAEVMMPYLDEAYSLGVRSIVECSTVGVGRNVEILAHLAKHSPIHIVAPTGVYREGFIPEELISLTAEELAGKWIQELTFGMEGTSIRAGFIKIAASDDGPTKIEERNLRAAAIASSRTGAVVGSHTTSGDTVSKEIKILSASGLSLDRFIWIHANLEPEFSLHLEAARMGVNIEYDGVGASWQDQEAMVEATMAMREAGHIGQLLLSHDAGWYQPGRPGGRPEEGIRGYDSLTREFLPLLRERGLDEADIQQITVQNPARIFAFG
jgi:phosphotriesterase-related protein